ncbi:unnamed protein product [Caretta caretta]
MPLLTVSPEYSTYRVGNSVTFTCLTPKGHQAMRLQFLRDGAEVDSAETQSQLPHTYNLPRLNVHDSGSYRCRYWTPGQKIPSKLSDPITINVYAPRDTGERRFHFYRDGAEFIPGNTRSQISTTGQGTGSTNVSVLRIPRASPSSTGKFTCEYVQKVCQKWVPSPRSQAVNITMTADKVFLLRFLVVGGFFFITNGLIFLISHCCL